MFRSFVVVFFVAGFLTNLHAQDADTKEIQPKPNQTNSLKDRINQYIEAGKSGVFYQKEDTKNDGEIFRLFVVGTAPINTVLGLEEGLESAQERADEQAKTNLLTFLESKVAITKNVKGETILSIEGDGSSDNPRQSGKKIDKRTKEFTETASSILKGLRIAGSDQDGKNKKYIVVYRLDYDSLNSIDNLNNRLNTKVGSNTSSNIKKSETEKGSKKSSSNKVPSKRVIIDD